MLIPFDCYITQDFVAEFSKSILELNDRAPYRVKQLILHGCHLHNLNVSKFYRLLFELIHTKNYIFSCISGCKLQHLQFDVISKYPAVQNARQIHLFGIRGISASMLLNGPTDEQLLNIILFNKTKYPNLKSIQLSGYNLTQHFISKR